MFLPNLKREICPKYLCAISLTESCIWKEQSQPVERLAWFGEATVSIPENYQEFGKLRHIQNVVHVSILVQNLFGMMVITYFNQVFLFSRFLSWPAAVQAQAVLFLSLSWRSNCQYHWGIVSHLGPPELWATGTLQRRIAPDWISSARFVFTFLLLPCGCAGPRSCQPKLMEAGTVPVMDDHLGRTIERGSRTVTHNWDLTRAQKPMRTHTNAHIVWN